MPGASVVNVREPISTPAAHPAVPAAAPFKLPSSVPVASGLFVTTQSPSPSISQIGSSGGIATELLLNVTSSVHTPPTTVMASAGVAGTATVATTVRHPRTARRHHHD